MTSPPEPTVEVSGLTDVGRERQRNEDQFLIARLERTLRVEATSVPAAEGTLPGGTEGTVMLVADGMGGTTAGDVASSVAVKAIAEYVCTVLPWVTARPQAKKGVPPARGPAVSLPGVRLGLTDALVQGDAQVREAARTRGSRDMGTTLTLGYIQWPHLYVAHVGDSRCYLLREGRMRQLTTDHTLAARLREQSSKMDIDESSPWHHVLWNALGGGGAAAIEPEVVRQELAPNDVLILCSDGLTKHVADPAIAHVVNGGSSASEICDALMQAALSGGGSDNITVVVARCVPHESHDILIDSLEDTLPVDSDSPTIRRKAKRTK